MTLIDDLQALDLSAIVDARAAITVTADGPQLQRVLSGGAGTAALGGLGTALDALRAVVEHPETLLDDVVAALPALDAADGLARLDLAGWEAAVTEGAELVADLVAALGGDLSKLGATLLDAGGDQVGGALRTVEDYAHVGVDEVARLRRLIDSVSGAIPADGEAFARLALDVLFPGPSADVLAMRAAVSGLLGGASGIALPEGRIAGLLDGHAAVAAAARDGDGPAIRAALSALERARDDTQAALEGDLRFALEKLAGLGAPQALAAITAASAGVQAAHTGVLEFLDRLRGELQAARAGVDGLDPADAHAAIIAFLDGVEARAQELLVAPVQERVEAVEAWVRGVFADLPLRALRAELTELVAGAVAAIEAADLDGPAEALRARLDALEARVAGMDVGAVVRDALTEVEQVISGALDAIASALESIGAAVEALADGARDVVEAAVGILQTLAGAVSKAKQALDELPIEAARDEVIATVRDLRAKAEELLSEATLPEGVRPLVDQLIEQIRHVDVEAALLGPVDAALADFHVLADLGLPDLVTQVQRTLSNLVPAQIAAELEAQLDAVLSGIRAFSPAGLEDVVERFLGDAATAIEGVELAPVREVVHAPFALVLDAFDQLAPSVLLRPVLDAYDANVGAAGLPDPVAAAQGLIGAAADAAGQLTPPLADAAARVVPEAQRTAPQVPAEAPPGMPRAGDVVRLFGWLPAQLRDALGAVGPEARAGAVAALNDVVGGLAGDLRRLHAEAFALGDRFEADLDAMLAPLAAAQAGAQLALTARLTGRGVTLEVDLDASLDVVASAGAGAVRDALGETTGLVAGSVDRLAGTVARSGTAIEAAAAALERSPLATLATDVDAFLAALDPEPLAAELDALIDAAVGRLPGLVDELGAELEAVITRARQILLDLNPAVLLQRFLTVLDVVRDELDVLNPHTIARELDAIHDAARATLEAYDPAVLVDEVGDLLRAVGAAIRAVDLGGFPGEADLPELAAAVARLDAAAPTAALEGAGAALAAAGEALRAFDLVGLVAEVDELPARIQEGMHDAVRAVKDELIALLGALQYQQTSASGSVSASGGIG